MGPDPEQQRTQTPCDRIHWLYRLTIAAALWYCLGTAVGAVSAQTLPNLVEARLSGIPAWSEGSLDWPVLKKIYSAHRYQPLWISDSGDHADVTRFIEILQHSTEHGLPGRNYHLQSIRQQLTQDQAEERVWLDLLLTDAFLKYVSDMGTGHIDPQLNDQSWHIQRPTLNTTEMLETVLRDGSLIETLHGLTPASKEYRELMLALQIYTQLQANGGWQALPPGPILKHGDRHPLVVQLRQRLMAEGELPPQQVIDPDYFDADLKQALTNFQLRHGLEADGAYGPETRKAANVPVAHRIAQIKLNLERQRWLPRHREDLHVEVNLVDFRLDVMEAGQSILHMPVIIGRRDRSTPALDNAISYMVINPEWNIPNRIAREELVPEQVRDAGYFQRLDIKAMSGWGQQAAEIGVDEIDWQQWLDGESPYRLVQRAGHKNSLGRIKFMFPNPFNVYLHDTPYPELFELRVRAFSHGCIRISRPIEFAETLLNRLSESDPAALKDAIDSGETRIIPLPRPVPVYLLYKSAWMDEADQVHFRDDVYNRDRRMIAYLLAQSG